MRESSCCLFRTVIKQMLLKHLLYLKMGVQWLSDRVLYSGPRGRGFEPHQHHCVVSLSKSINPRLCKESNQTNKTISRYLDDSLNIDSPYFEQMVLVSQIYLIDSELQLNKVKLIGY